MLTPNLGGECGRRRRGLPRKNSGMKDGCDGDRRLITGWLLREM